MESKTQRRKDKGKNVSELKEEKTEENKGCAEITKKDKKNATNGQHARSREK